MNKSDVKNQIINYFFFGNPFLLACFTCTLTEQDSCIFLLVSGVILLLSYFISTL